MASTNEDIIRALTRVETLVEGLTKAFETEQGAAHESRSAIHRRLDEQVTQTAYLDKTVAIHAQIDAQLRDEIAGLSMTVAKNHEAVTPALDEWRRLKILGYGVSGLLVVAGASVAGLVYWAGEAAVSAVRHWLKIQ